MKSKWHIADVRPAGVVAPVTFRVPWLFVCASGAVKRTSTVVRAQHDQRVFVFTLGFEICDELSAYRKIALEME